MLVSTLQQYLLLIDSAVIIAVDKLNFSYNKVDFHKRKSDFWLQFLLYKFYNYEKHWIYRRW